MLLRVVVIGVGIGDQNRKDGAHGILTPASRKGVTDMMDCLMAGTLLIGFGLVWMLVTWCHRQVESQE